MSFHVRYVSILYRPPKELFHKKQDINGPYRIQIRQDLKPPRACFGIEKSLSVLGQRLLRWDFSRLELRSWISRNGFKIAFSILLISGRWIAKMGISSIAQPHHIRTSREVICYCSDILRLLPAKLYTRRKHQNTSRVIPFSRNERHSPAVVLSNLHHNQMNSNNPQLDPH